MTISDNTLQLIDFNVATSATLEVVTETITEVAMGGLMEEIQRVEDVLISSIELISEDKGDEDVVNTRRRLQQGVTTKITYDLILDELCRSISCEELAQTTTMGADVTSYMSDEITNGGFTAVLQVNAEECGAECNEIQNAQVTDGTFGDDDVEVVTSMPTRNPTRKPSLRPSSEVRFVTANGTF